VKRHHNDIHEKVREFVCPVKGCKYARDGKEGGFSRKDNWKRHMKGKHGAKAKEES